MPLITIPDNPADRGYDLSLKGKSNRESLLRNCHYGITLKLLIIPIKTTVGTKDSRSAIEEKIQRLKKKKSSLYFHELPPIPRLQNRLRFALSRARARTLSIRARTQAKGLSLSLSPEGQKVSSPYPKACNENRCRRDGGQPKFLKRWMKAHSRIEVCRYNITCSLATQIDSIARLQSASTRVPISLEIYDSMH